MPDVNKLDTPPILTPSHQSSRPVTPSPRTSSTNIHVRRPSSSLSHSSATSRRTPPDPSLPQRLPRHHSPQEAAAFTELHQELETEQEAQVNRLLNLIRLQHLQTDDNMSTAATIDSASTTTPASRRGSGRLSRENSARRPSGSFVAASFIGDEAAGGNVPWLGSAHSDMAFYVAESQMLARENEMLKRRIRELEKQVAELGAKAGDDSGAVSVVGEAPASESGSNIGIAVGEPALPEGFVHAL